jgi:hypothetical protein
MGTSRSLGIAALLVVLVGGGFYGGWRLGRVPARHDLPVRRVAAERAGPGTAPRAKPLQLRTPDAGSVEPARPHFADVAPKLGIDFAYFRGETGEYWLPETMGGGVAWLDYDGDGKLDLYFVQGCQLPQDSSGRHVNVLYRQAAEGPWQQAPRWTAPSDAGYGMGAAVADFDNDGFEDLYVTNFGPDAFYRNNGDGTFSDSTRDAALGCPLWGTSAAFADLDRDGDLDLFVANYVQADPAIQCSDPATQARKYCGPDYYSGQPSVCYENLANGRFAEISETAGLSPGDGKALGVVIADLLDSDGWPDIFVAQDLVPNSLFRNLTGQTRGRPSGDNGDADFAGLLEFQEVGMAVGAALNGEGIREANMGIACGDYDENGQLDLYVTHYHMEHDTLWQNHDGAQFRDVTQQVGLALPTLPQLSWGTNFVDFDNDGRLDLFVTSGHINNYGDGSSVPYAMRAQLFHNAGGLEQPARFRDVSFSAGPYFSQRYVGRGSAAADFDRDGRIDLAVTHHQRAAALLHNQSQPSGNAVGFRLVGRQSGRSAFGVRVLLELREAGGSARRLVRQVIGGGSYLSADARELVVGVGSADRVAGVRIHWPSGVIDQYANLPTGGYWIIREAEPASQFLPFEQPR